MLSVLLLRFEYFLLLFLKSQFHGAWFLSTWLYLNYFNFIKNLLESFFLRFIVIKRYWIRSNILLDWLPFSKLLFNLVLVLLKLQQQINTAIRCWYSGRSQHLMLRNLFKVLVLPNSIQCLLLRSTNGLLLLNELNILLSWHRMDSLMISRLRNKRWSA